MWKPSCGFRRLMTAKLRNAVWLSLAALSMTPAPAAAAEVTVQKSDLFVARQGGYHTYRIPGIVMTLDGTLLAYATARDKDIWDYGNYDTVLRRSTDGGKTWSPMEVFVHAGKSTVDNCVLIVDRVQKGVVHHLYCVDYAAHLLSSQRGQRPDVLAARGDHKTVCGLCVGVQVHHPGDGPGPRHPTGQRPADRADLALAEQEQQFPSAVSVIYSDDHGDTWNRGPIIVRSGDPPNHPMEGVVAQLSDGRVMMNIRNEADVHRRAVSYSPNGATDWTAAKFDPNLPEPICFGSLLAVPREIAGVKGVLLFSNPDNVARSVNIGPKHYCDRKNVTVKLSLNDGTDWVKSLVIEPGFSGYSDLCVGPDGTVYCLYERGAITSYYDPAAVSLARFNILPVEARTCEVTDVLWQSQIRGFHAGGAVGGHHDHRNSHRFAVARRAGGPRGRPPLAMCQQPQADRAGAAELREPAPDVSPGQHQQADHASRWPRQLRSAGLHGARADFALPRNGQRFRAVPPPVPKLGYRERCGDQHSHPDLQVSQRQHGQPLRIPPGLQPVLLAVELCLLFRQRVLHPPTPTARAFPTRRSPGRA